MGTKIALLLLFTFLVSCQEKGKDINNEDVEEEINIDGTVSQIRQLILPSAFASELPKCTSICKTKTVVDRCARLSLITPQGKEIVLCKTIVDKKGKYNFNVKNPKALAQYAVKVSIEDPSGLNREAVKFIDPKYDVKPNINIDQKTTATTTLVLDDIKKNQIDITQIDHTEQEHKLHDLLLLFCPKEINLNNVDLLLKSKNNILAGKNNIETLLKFKNFTEDRKTLPQDMEKKRTVFCNQFTAKQDNPPTTSTTSNKCLLDYSTAGLSLTYSDQLSGFILKSFRDIGKEPDPGIAWLSAGGWGPSYNFGSENNVFMLSIKIPDEILKAGLTGVNLKAEMTSFGGLSSNDGLSLFIFDEPQTFSKPLPQPKTTKAAQPKIINSFGSAIQDGNSNSIKTFVDINLSQLKNRSLTQKGDLNLIPDLQKKGVLHLYIQDDQSIHNVRLRLESPACSTTKEDVKPEDPKEVVIKTEDPEGSPAGNCIKSVRVTNLHYPDQTCDQSKNHFVSTRLTSYHFKSKCTAPLKLVEVDQIKCVNAPIPGFSNGAVYEGVACCGN